MMTIREATARGVELLRRAGITGGRLDTQLLLSGVLDLDRIALFIHADRELSAEQERRFLALIERRGRREPIAYILGTQEFYGRAFLVDRRVLIPRPETELLTEAALLRLRAMMKPGVAGADEEEQGAMVGRPPVVADIGTGSGVIAITIALEEPRLPFIYASDVSHDALDVARLNCLWHGVDARVRLVQGHLLEPLPEPVDLLIANLPYVGTNEVDTIEADVLDYEPRTALFSGEEGLDLMHLLLQDVTISGKVSEHATVLLEIGYRQGEPLQRLARKLLPRATTECIKDYAGLDRIFIISL